MGDSAAEFQDVPWRTVELEAKGHWGGGRVKDRGQVTSPATPTANRGGPEEFPLWEWGALWGSPPQHPQVQSELIHVHWTFIITFFPFLWHWPPYPSLSIFGSPSGHPVPLHQELSWEWPRHCPG